VTAAPGFGAGMIESEEGVETVLAVITVRFVNGAAFGAGCHQSGE
jgi:hypothetical protein